jgi:hypothetical protein
MSVKEFLTQYETKLTQVDPVQRDSDLAYIQEWVKAIFGTEFLVEATTHVRHKSAHEVWIMRDHCVGDQSFSLEYIDGEECLIRVHFIDDGYKSQTYAEFEIHLTATHEDNLSLLANALRQVEESIKAQAAEQTDRLARQMSEFNMRAQTWIPCDLEIYLMGQYAASGLPPQKVVLYSKQLLHLLLNSETAQPGSLRNPKIAAAIEKTLKKTQRPEKEF